VLKKLKKRKMDKSKPVWTWLVFLMLALVWGSSFILMKRGLEVFSPGELGALRVVITWLFLIPFAVKHLKTSFRIHWKALFAAGLIGSLIPAFLFAAAQKGIDSSLAGILNSLTPLFTLLIGMLFFKTHPRWYNIAGVFTGLGGAVGLVSVSGSGNFTLNIGFSALIVIATVLYAINVNLIKAFLSDVNPVAITALSFFTIGPMAAVYLFAATPFVNTMTYVPGAAEGFGYIAILAVVGTGIALMLYNRLILASSAVFASSVTYFIPVVALMWGILDGERFKPGFLMWVLMVIAGVLMVNTSSLDRWKKLRQRAERVNFLR